MNTRLILLLWGAATAWGCSGEEDSSNDSSDAGEDSGAASGGSNSSSGSGNASGGASSGNGGTATGSGGASSSSGGSGSGCTLDYECQPEPPPASDDPAADCVARVNQFRACVCLPPLERWTEAESCASAQAEYDVEHGAHAGFRDKICSPRGWAQNECPGWGSVGQVIDGCLQMMFDEGPPPQTPCEGACFQAHGHFLNMTNTDYSRVACGFHTTGDGKVWAIQNFE